MARHGRAGVHRVSEQLHDPEQPAVDDRQARDDVRASRRSGWTPTSASAPTAAWRRSASATRRPPASTPPGTLLPTTGNAYASFLLGELNTTTVIEDSQVATSGRFYTYAFWAQDDFKVTPKLTLNLGLRYDIMKPYTEMYDRWSFMNPDLPNPARRRYRGALQFAGYGENSCQCRTPIETYYGRRPAARRRLQPDRADGAARRLRHHAIRAAARSAVAPARETAPGSLGFSANADLPEPDGFDPGLQLEQRRAVVSGAAVLRSHAQHRLRDGPGHGRRRHLRRSRDRRASAALSELERRPAVRARRRTITVGATYAGSNGDFLGGSRRGFFSNQLDPKYPRARQPADAAGDARQRRRGARPSCPAWRCPTRTSRAPSRRCCGRSRSTQA